MSGNFIIGNRVDYAYPVCASFIVQCQTCKEAVWISPASAIVAAAKGAAPLCIQCAADVLNECNGNVDVAPPSQGQLDELAAHIRRN